MTALALVVPLASLAVWSLWFGWRLTSIIKADGYGFRSSSGLPRDWAPTELPSTPYVARPHF